MEAKNNFSGKSLNYNVLLREIENKNENEVGIDITSLVDRNEKYRKGIIVSIGNLIISEVADSCIEIGKEVIFDNYKSSEITIGGVLYKNIVYSDLVMVM